jgi:hypothetical protein
VRRSGQVRGSVVTSDAGLLAYCELDGALGLSETAGERLGDARTGKNGRHATAGTLRPPCCGRRCSRGFRDTRVSRTPRGCATIPRCDGSSAARRLMVVQPRRAKWAALATRWLTAQSNLLALSDASGRWIDQVHRRRPPPSATRHCVGHGFERR